MIDHSSLLASIDQRDLSMLVFLEAKEAIGEGKDIFFDGEDLLRLNKPALIDWYLKLLATPQRNDYLYIEPTAYPDILNSRPAKQARFDLPEALDLNDRILGGWLGRTAGCVLGKPVEGWQNKNVIIHYLKRARSYPLEQYIPRLDPMPEGFYFGPGAQGALRREIHGAPVDDDTDYTILGLHMLEAYGLRLQTVQVASEWLNHLAYTRTYTAERAAYRNLVLGFPPEEAAVVLNPEREYIGARIRADIYGFICPGQPEIAAKLAYQDAALSHTKNGVYSAMMMAAMIAWAFVSDNMEEIIQVGLLEIPESCRLAEAVLQVLHVFHSTMDWEEAYNQLLPSALVYNSVHAINNHVLMVLALLYGESSFEKTVTTAVLCGFDTDCNAANAGAVVGVIRGARNLSSKWIEPLEDTLRTSVAEFGDSRISNLAARTTELARKHTFLTENPAS